MIRAAPPPKSANAAGGGVCGQTEQLGHLNSSGSAPWQQGLSAGQIRAVDDHRHTKPQTPLPATLQRELGASWRQHAARLR